MPVCQRQWQEGALTFVFATAAASKYDDWSFYRNQFQNGCGRGNKAVDLVYRHRQTAWLIEIKDYRQQARTKAADLADEIALKVRDSLAGLMAASTRANDAEERHCARELVLAEHVRVVCHLEQPARRTRLRPRAIEPDKLKQQLRSLLKGIDPHPAVMDSGTVPTAVHWTVT